MTSTTAGRVVCYVDGFNLYFGMKAARLKRFYWLNIQELASRLTKPGQQLIGTKYFTSRISGALPSNPPNVAQKKNAKLRRQTTFLEALATIDGLEIFEGHFLEKDVTCRLCRATFRQPEEKMTDVNIATELLTDAFLDRFDTAILISGDSDLVPPVSMVRKHFPAKKIIVAFPPKRFSNRLAQASTAHFKIFDKVLRDSQLPNTVTRPDGFVLARPTEWV